MPSLLRATALLLAACASQARARGETPGIMQRSAEVTAADLQRVAAMKVGFAEASRIIRSVERDGNAALIDALKSAVAAWSTDPEYAVVAHYGLDRLWELGEPRGYFLANLARYRDNRRLAYYSILVLGREPDDELMRTLDRVEADVDDDNEDQQLHRAIGRVRETREVIATYRGARDLGERIDLVLRHAGSTWNPISGMRSDAIDLESPLPFWARDELEELSAEHGPTIAQRLAALDVGRHYGKGEEAQRYAEEARNYIAQFLPKEVQEMYEKLARTPAANRSE